MTAVRRNPAGLAAVALTVGLAFGGCTNARGMADTRRALEGSGYRDVAVTLRTGGGIDVARVEAAPDGAPPPEVAAEVVWTTLPVRFDQLVVALDGATTLFRYDALAERLGPRTPSLDRRQVSEEVVEDGLELMLLLTGAAVLSVAGVVGAGFLVLRAARRQGRDDQAEGPTSGLGDDSPTAADPVVAEDPPAIPS